MQTLFAEQASIPGVHVLEAPMGMGKTEAALYAAYRLLASGQASGIYFALPTRLTSDKMHARVRTFLHRISADKEPLLLHGKARLLKILGTLGADASPGNTWFSTSKRGLLAPFAVGTIDQALLSVLAVKHSFVRGYGLSGKVVILDEVHSYDDYTGTLLDKLIKQLYHMSCTVIILSATLTRERRTSLLGRETTNTAYPLASSVYDQQIKEQAYPTPPDAEVRVRTDQSDDEAFEEALKRAEEGQRVLWIENTVNDAQNIYIHFSARAFSIGVQVGLLHSHFTPKDRTHNEEKWTTLYASGRPAPTTDQLGGCILIGTQVLEQSLDIDADFLVTRFCPSDMLFQRLGRLWRNINTARPKGAVHEAWILAPALEDAITDPQHAFGVSGVIYRPYVLARSLEVWANKKSLHLPSDIRPVMEAVYQSRPVDSEPSDAMRKVRANLESDRRSYRRKALSGMDISHGLHPEDAKTRLDECPSSDVLLLKDWDAINGVAVGLDGTRIDIRNAKTAAARAHAAALLEENLLQISQKSKFVQHACLSKRSADILSHCLHSAIGDDPSLRLFIVHDDESLSDEGGRAAGASYAPDTGLIIEKDQGN